MDIEILKEKDMQLLSRRRISAMIRGGSATPSRLDIKKGLADKLGIDPELVVVKHIYPRYGKTDVKIISHVYSNTDDMNKFELKKLVEKHKAKEKPAEAPKEETKVEEKPAEAPKEEAKAEEKPAEVPKEETKVEEKPAEAPKEETKVEEKPAEAPKEEAKAEEAPAEKKKEEAKTEKAKSE